MKRRCGAVALAIGLAWPLPLRAAPASFEPVPHNAQTAIVQTYLRALHDARYDAAFRLLNDAARAYYRDAQNLRSIYAADAYRITSFTLLGAHGDDVRGRVYFARETARFRDHAHDVDLKVTATVPVGVVPEHGGWSIKDPGHPWRAFATRASAHADGVVVRVKKVSFFTRRIEAVVSFANSGERFVTVLPYGKSVLRDAAGHPYRLIETRDWSLTDKVLFEGLRLAPNARYTGTLAFVCEPLDDSARTFALTVAPFLADGGDAPFAIRVEAIAADPAAPAAQ
jgi:hypothetical protein